MHVRNVVRHVRKKRTGRKHVPGRPKENVLVSLILDTAQEFERVLNFGGRARLEAAALIKFPITCSGVDSDDRITAVGVAAGADGLSATGRYAEHHADRQRKSDKIFHISLPLGLELARC